MNGCLIGLLVMEPLLPRQSASLHLYQKGQFFWNDTISPLNRTYDVCATNSSMFVKRIFPSTVLLLTQMICIPFLSSDSAEQQLSVCSLAFFNNPHLFEIVHHHDCCFLSNSILFLILIAISKTINCPYYDQLR